MDEKTKARLFKVFDKVKDKTTIDDGEESNDGCTSGFGLGLYLSL